LSFHGYVVGRKSFLQQAPVRSTLFSIRDYLDKSTNKQVAIKAYTKNDNTHKAKGYQKNDHQLKIIDKRLGSHGGCPILGPKEMDAVVC
jgi:hypothetical protein